MTTTDQPSASARPGAVPEPAARFRERREDYALRIVPQRYRQWGWTSLLGVLMGATTAMVYLALGGQFVVGYGTRTLIAAMVICTIFLGALGYVWTSAAARTGLDSQLLTRGAGFGFVGTAFTSLIYSFNFIIFSATEGAIMANAIHAQYGIPLWVLYLAIGLVMIPLTWYGVTAMNWIMWVTIPVYIGFMTWAIVKAAQTDVHTSFWSFHATQPPSSAGGPGLLQLLAAVIAVISNAALAADIGRFAPVRQRRAAAFAMGYVFEAVTLLGVTMLGAWFAVRLGGTDPGAYITHLLGFWGAVFVIITQIRINVLNTYSGSLAYANFFARLFHFTPGRHWWVALTALAGTGLMLGGVYNHLSQVLTFEGVFVIAWMMAVTSDMVVNKRWLKLSPPEYPFRRAQTYQFNPVGMGALVLALIAAEPLAFGVAGALGKNLAPFVSMAVAFAAAPVIAALTRGRYYRAPTSAVELDPTGNRGGVETCVKCGERFELMELVRCPFLTGPLCSMCCAAERDCGELCKQEGRKLAPAGPSTLG